MNRQQTLKRLRDHARRHNISDTRIGRMVVDNPHLIRVLANPDAGVTQKTLDRVNKWLDENPNTTFVDKRYATE